VLVVELKNDYVKGQYDYPIDLATSFADMTNCSSIMEIIK